MIIRKLTNDLLALICRLSPKAKDFDAAWYCARYRDVADSGIDPLLHYCRFGYREGRDPNPMTSLSGERLTESPQFSVSRLGDSGILAISGDRELIDKAPTILCCGHQAGHELYGAERSFLDTLAVLAELKVNLVVTLPEAFNEDYLAAIRPHCSRLLILPYGWWAFGTEPQPMVVERFQSIIESFGVSAVYANTVVLFEPLIAGRIMAVPVSVHVRELPYQDPSLCALMRADAEAVIQHLRETSDFQLVNSRFTGETLRLDDPIVIPNSVNVENFKSISPPDCESHPLRVGMISSNLPKKGLDDFIALAGIFADEGSPIRFKLIGPENEHTRLIERQQAAGEISDNIDILGYIASPQAALNELDVLLNLSHFEESFGRTVLEAMAAARPVVVYDRGALSELVRHKQSGYLVKFGHIEGIKRCIERFLIDPQLLCVLGQSGKRRATEQFGVLSVKAGLEHWLDLVYSPRKTG
ncbi:glycosyltransferase family 4 protein [uncultured Marinimicrobium sp.]|uniref:glycosyltransferase family 4 protein n=1 Tax=uncultured Marinimicrobium sp. TaxID=503840 RepID=UPI0030D9B619